MFKRTLHALWLLCVLLLFLAAAVLTTARLLVPALSQYRHEIENAASEVFQKQVSIGRMEATWRGLNPVLKLKQVVLAEPGSDRADAQSCLELREIWITIDAQQFLTNQQVKPAAIDIIGADLTVIRDAQGQFYLDRFNADGSSESGLDELMDMTSLSVHDVSVTFIDELYDEPPLRLSAIALSLSNQGDTHTLTGHALLPGEVGYRVDVEAELYGDSHKPASWQGQLYAKGQSLSFPAIAERYLPAGISLQGVADIRLWASVAALQVQAFSGELDTHDLTVTHLKEAQQYVFRADQLQGQFGWRQNEEGWQFALQQLLVRQGERTWKTEALSLAGHHHEQGSHIKGVSALIELDGLGALLSIAPGLEPEARVFLAELHPRGLIQDLTFSVSSEAGVTRVDRFSARFAGLGTGEVGGFTVISGLDGTLAGSLEAGTLTLDTQNASIYDTRLFRQALPIERAQGALHWLLQDGHFEVRADNLTISNQDLSLAAKVAVDVPAESGAPSINLDLAVERVDVGRVHAYLPVTKLSPTAVAWLDSSLKSGTITDGSVVINGRFDQLPFDNGEGILEVRLPVTNAVLDFNPGWSPLLGIDAQVNFSGRSMDILGDRATMRSASLENIRVQIQDLAKPVLTIKGDARGALPVMLAELGSSTLQTSYGGFVDSVTTSGEAALSLDIVLPLTGTQAPVQVGGKITLQDNSLSVNGTEFALQDISGRLSFDARGIEGKDLHATLFGQPAVARVWVDAGVTHIRLEGPFAVLEKYLGKGNAVGDAISGSSEWQVLVLLRGMPERGKQADVGVVVSSNLAGTRVDLPAPFGKDGGSIRALSINIDNAVAPVKTLRIQYGKVLEGLLDITTGEQGAGLQKGVIAVGGLAPVMPNEKVMLVSGNMERVYVTEWKPHLGGEGGVGLPVKLNMHVDELEVQGYLLDDVSVLMESAGRVWNIKAEGPATTGDIQLKSSAAGLDKVVMTMDRLTLRSSEQPQSESPDKPDKPDKAGKAMPTDFPDLDVTAKQFVYNKTEFGKLELKAFKQPGSKYFVERMALSSELLDMHMNANWQLDGGQQISSINLKVEQGKMDRLMRVFGYQKSIEDGELSGTLRVSWPGALWDFAPATAGGSLRLKIEDGQLLDVDPGAAGRVLGLTSLNQLPRRLLLDFSDLYEHGFSFNKIKGSFTLDAGNAYTNDLLIDGPAARIEISGRVGLADEDYDELVTVTPYMKTGLSVAGTLAGGPAVGAVIILAETLLKDKLGPLGRIGQAQYTITGPWADPVIVKLGSTEADTAAETDAGGEAASGFDEYFN